MCCSEEELPRTATGGEPVPQRGHGTAKNKWQLQTPVVLKTNQQTQSTGSSAPLPLSIPHGLGFLECVSVASFNMALCPLFPAGSDSEESAFNAGDPGSVPELGRSPGKGNGYRLQYSCLENPLDRRAWCATVHGVAKSQIWLSDLHFDFSVLSIFYMSVVIARNSIKSAVRFIVTGLLYWWWQVFPVGAVLSLVASLFWCQQLWMIIA